MSYKIIRVLNDKVSVASDDGSFFDIGVSELDFFPKIGDKVNVFVNGNIRIVSRIGFLNSSVDSAGGECKKNIFDDENSRGGTSSSKIAMIIGIIIGLTVILYCLGTFLEGGILSDDEYEIGYEIGFSIAGEINENDSVEKLVGLGMLMDGGLMETLMGADLLRGNHLNLKNACSEAFSQYYVAKYGAPYQGEMMRYNKYKEKFMEGCEDGYKAYSN